MRLIGPHSKNPANAFGTGRKQIALAFAVLWAIFLAGAAIAAANAPSDSENAAYLVNFRKQPGVLSRPSGLEYRVLSSGFGKRPGPNDTVEINYNGRLINGTVFDGSTPGLPASFAVNGVIQGLNEALQLMHEGDHWQVAVPSNLAFGVRGTSNGSVPPNQTLVFDLTLVAVSNVPPATSDNSSPLAIGADQRGEKATFTFHP